MKRLIIIIFVLLVVAGGGAGGLIMLGIVRNPFIKPSADAVAAAAAAADAKAKAFKGPEEALTFVKMPDMVIPVIVNGGVQRRIYVNMRLQCNPPEKPRVQAELARFQSEVLSDLVTYFQTYFEKSDLIDVGALKKKLSSHAAHVYGEAVKEVLIINVFEAGTASGARSGIADMPE